MGVRGLLGLLKSIQKPVNLKSLAGQTLGVDAYGWLHRGVTACAVELALDKPTTKHIDFVVNKVRMLLDFGITPYLVFDGDAVPSKAGTNEERRKIRTEAKALGLELYRANRTAEAFKELQKAASVTPSMARQFIEELKLMNVPYVVAPFEADAQLVYLERQKIIDGILSEDSDMLVFGAQRLLTKLDQYGNCLEIRRKDFIMCKEVSLAGWTDAMFMWMAIMSGCDYLPNIEGVGIRTAYDLIRKCKDPNKAIRMLAFKGKASVPADYQTKFRNAELTFLHHRVFCPLAKKMVFLNDLGHGQKEEDMPFLGAYVDPEIAVDVARGHLNPKTKEPLKYEPPLTKLFRPLLKNNRRQTLGSPADLKLGKSLDSFFKPQRRPLAELEPNSLTPSPSQQRVLERNANASWEPRTVYSEPPTRAGSTRVYLDRHSSPSSEGREAYLTNASKVTSHNSTKRQRLCSESGEVVPSDGFTKSPFFASGNESASPLALKKTRDRKVKKSDFDVWSDDSVEQAMLALQNIQQNTDSPLSSSQKIVDDWSFTTTPQPNGHLELKEEFVHKRVTNESQSSHGTAQLSGLELDSEQHSQASLSVGKTEGNEGTETVKLVQISDFHTHDGVRRRDASQTFFRQSPEAQLAALKTLKSYSYSELVPPEAHQKAKQSAKSNVQETPGVSRKSLSQTFVHQSPEKQVEALSSLRGVQTIAETPTAKKKYTADEPKPPSQLYEIPGVGSEDALVPNSEDEISEVGDDELKPRILDLKAFAYTA